MRVFVLLVVVLTVLSLTEAKKVKDADKAAAKAAKAEKKCAKFVKKYAGCLKKGFKSNICEAKEEEEEEVEEEEPADEANDCPATHPYVYYDGEYCCASDKEKVYKPQGALCDGSKIGRTSKCCLGDAYKKCPFGKCSNYVAPEGPKPAWSKHEGQYLGGYSSGAHMYDTLEQAQAQCVTRNDCGGITYETRGSKKYTLRKDTVLRGSPSAEISWKLMPKLTGTWSVIPGGLTRIAKGKSGIWGVNVHGGIYQLNADGKSWTKIAGALVQVASGAEVWGVNSGDNIYKYLGNNKWQHMPGKLTNIDVSDNGNVWGVNRGQNIYRWLGSSWQHIGGAAIQVSVGHSGVWVVNAANNIYYRTGTRGDPNVAGTGWVHVPGKLKWIASGKGLIVGVNSINDIYYRDGISDKAPTGTKWVKIDGKLSQIAVYDDEVVGTNPAHKIFRTPYIWAPKPKPATKPAPKPAPKPAKTSPVKPAVELSAKDLKKCGKMEKKLKKCDYKC